MSPKQKKIAAKAPPPNVFNEKDLAVLREEKAKGRGMGLQDEKLNPGKIYKAKRGSGLDLPVINSVKPAVHKTKRAQNLSNMKIQFTKQKNRAGANPSSHFDKKNANVVKHTRVPGSKFTERRMKLEGAKKVSVPFIERRMKLAGVAKAASATRIGKIALGIGAAGVAAQQYLKSKMNKKDEPKKKMGGGMMQRPMGYTKGGGADTGTLGERKSKLGVALQKVRRDMKKYGKDTDRLTQRDIEFAKQSVKFNKMNVGGMPKKMGGGMMQRPMGYNIGGYKSKEDRKEAEKNIKQARSKEGLRSFLSDAPKINQPMRKERYMEGRKARHSAFKKKLGRTAAGIASSLNPVTSSVRLIGKVMGKESKKRDFQKGDYGDISVKKMGGGMMQKPMGYRTGTMIKARGCKLGRTRPTKIT